MAIDKDVLDQVLAWRNPHEMLAKDSLKDELMSLPVGFQASVAE